MVAMYASWLPARGSMADITSPSCVGVASKGARATCVAGVLHPWFGGTGGGHAGRPEGSLLNDEPLQVTGGAPRAPAPVELPPTPPLAPPVAPPLAPPLPVAPAVPVMVPL